MYFDDSGDDYKELENSEFLNISMNREKSVGKIFEENDKIW